MVIGPLSSILTNGMELHAKTQLNGEWEPLSLYFKIEAKLTEDLKVLNG